MTSRDGYNRNRPAAQPQRSAQRQNPNWEVDANDLDRYMSGQPAREPRFDPYGRSQSTGRTERPQSQPRQSGYAPQQEPVLAPEGEWLDDDYGYQDDYGYEEYQPEPVNDPGYDRQPARQQRQTTRTRAVEHEYDDDLYDDPYVLDDEDTPQRPQRRAQRPTQRQRAARQAPSLALPPMIAEAALVKDRMALGMLGAAALGLIVMIIVVATGRDSLDPTIFTHVNANGDPQNLQEASAIWRLPLIAGMVLAISSVLAWFLAKWGSFLPRFLIGGAIGVQFIVWVAVYAYLF